MERRPFIAGNWKMYLTLGEAVQLAQAVAATSAACMDRDVMVAPSFTSLAAICAATQGSNLLVGAQNIAWESEGAFTGEISAPMLKDLGVEWAIVGHSERRHIFGENNAMVNRRLHGALNGSIQPILCVGETLADREAGNTFTVLENQVREGLAAVTGQQMARVTLAYEPVWAIGTGKTASKEQAQEVHAFLRQLLANLYEKNIAEAVRILYGGSVKPDNIDDLMAQPDIDGALVGGAALKAESFDRIARFT
ncbi:triose-phosphate isomerase [Desulfobulbus sp.]|uniref:triose-phosphate isomerase n=1 Tax=Desulfobulbus sp. TaxID=895 RepID=UPI0027BA559D|nr:triose-phosphate isomerase [Desulfobulbus sp.]